MSPHGIHCGEHNMMITEIRRNVFMRSTTRYTLSAHTRNYRIVMEQTPQTTEFKELYST
jgi:hypothetical protein